MSGYSKARRTAWALVLLSSTACGGKSRVQGGDGEPSNGGASSGGATHVAGASQAGGAEIGGAPSSDCPDRQPLAGDTCNHDPDYCTYELNECRSVSFECVMHRWLPVPETDGAAYDCNSFTPPNAPHDGESCNCMGNLDCAYTDCADRGRLHAVCDNTTWHVTQSACEKSACGSTGLSCEPGSVCVVHAGFPPVFECAPNPCSVTPTSCDCAARLCGNNERCVIDSGDVACTSTTF